MAVYRSEVSWGPVTWSFSSPSDSRPSLYFSAHDDNTRWGIQALASFEAVGMGPSEVRSIFVLTFDVPDDPGSGSLISGTNTLFAPPGDNGALFLGGNTIAIEKDEAADELRFITPAGTEIRSLTSFGANDASKLRVHAMGYSLQRLNALVDTAHEEDWTNFYSKEDGTNFRGAALTDDKPGIWSGWTYGAVGANPLTFQESQQVAGYRTGMSYAVAQGLRDLANRRYRIWEGGDTVDAGPGSGLAIDEAEAREHGILFATYVYGTSMDTVRYRKSFDKGASWTEGTVYNAGGTSNNSPNVEWHEGRLWAVWHNGTSILQSFSRDFGTTWSTPVTLSITGTNPKLLISHKHGLQWYFYLDGANLMLLRSDNFGATFIDGSPITVATAIGAQTVGAAFGPDESILVGYIVSNTWTQKRSQDLGRTWS